MKTITFLSLANFHNPSQLFFDSSDEVDDDPFTI